MDYSKILFSEISFKPAPSKGPPSLPPPTSSAPSSKDYSSSNNNNNNNTNNNNSNGVAEEFRVPKQQLCDPNVIRLDWLQADKVGGGLINVGNTCFLNSVLQCLTYCPPLYNFLLHNGGHSNNCKINQFCMLCEMEKHVKRIKSSNGSPIKPVSIVQRLKYINKSFQFGRQEDAHEFLRYIIDHMWKACLLNLDINLKASKLDPRIKETTIINHIFGGYHRSQVLCLTCNSRSNTFDFFMDFILDIRHAKSLEDALKRFTQSEILENENAYKCSKCRKKVTARKKFTVYKAPNVATFQLKRFDSDRIFGGKITKFISYPEEFDLRPYMSDTTKSSIRYQLSAVLVHVGHSSNSGHYFCFIRNSNGFWYRMDDSNVSMVKKEAVLQQLAYVLFYTRKPSGSQPQSTISPQPTVNQQPTISRLLNAAPVTETVNNNGTSINNGTNINNNNNNSSNNISNNSTSSNHRISNNSPIPSSLMGSGLSTWFGNSKSKLDEEDPKKRKLNEMTDRDKFNEELDQGKTKKVKSRSRDDRFANLSKLNPFQRFASNGYQQYNKYKHNNKKHRGRHFNRR